MSYHGGSSEDMEASERALHTRRMEPGSRAFSTSTIHLTAQPASLRAQQPGRPKGHTSDDNLFDPSADREASPRGVRAPRPNSLESSRSASNSSSPLTVKGSSGFPPTRSGSVSSEDLVPTKDTATLSRESRSSSTMMVSGSKPEPPSQERRNSAVSSNLPEKRPPSRARSRPRSGSPGSEMVTLEEFLEESNHLSPPSRRHSVIDSELITLQEFLLEADSLHPSSHSPSPTLQHLDPPELPPRTESPLLENSAWRQRTEPASRRATSLYIPRDGSSGRDDLLADYFRRTGDTVDTGNLPGQPGYRDPRMIPVNYKSSSGSGDSRVMKPGQLVKPNLQPTATSPKMVHPMQAAVALSRQTPEPQHPGTLSARGTSLSRAFSLATADLLKANGPDVTQIERPDVATPAGKDFTSHILRTSTPTGSPRERPQSARMPNLPREDDLRSRSLDTRRISMASPNHDWTLPPAPSSGNLQPLHATTLPASRSTPRTMSRFGEVAMVSPLRPISSIPEAEGQTSSTTPKPPNISSEGLQPPAGEEETNKGGSTKSTPASPDPNSDPQTVWYEYGCV